MTINCILHLGNATLKLINNISKPKYFITYFYKEIILKYYAKLLMPANFKKIQKWIQKFNKLVDHRMFFKMNIIMCSVTSCPPIHASGTLSIMWPNKEVLCFNKLKLQTFWLNYIIMIDPVITINRRWCLMQVIFDGICSQWSQWFTGVAGCLETGEVKYYKPLIRWVVFWVAEWRFIVDM